MLILLDCRPLQTSGPDTERSRLILSAAAALSASDGVEWLMVADHRYRKGQFPDLPGRVVIRGALPGRPGWQWWYDRQLPRVAAKMGVDGAWLTGGVTGGMRVPVCLWMPERADVLERGGLFGYAALYRKRMRSSLGQAAAVVCYSERDRVWLQGIGPVGSEKVRVLSPIADESIGILTETQRTALKNHHTQGKEFFLADLTGCGEGEMVNLLKAFSLFKRRQRSQMRLILAGRGISEEMVERLKTYKYREDVDWYRGDVGLDRGDVDLDRGNVGFDRGKVGLDRGDVGWEDKNAPAGAAYAVLLPAEGISLGTTLLNRWKAGVPVIAAGGGLFEEMAEGAILPAAPGDPADLAAQLMRIYKEEDLRQELARRGLERLNRYSRENFLEVLRVITEIAAC